MSLREEAERIADQFLTSPIKGRQLADEIEAALKRAASSRGAQQGTAAGDDSVDRAMELLDEFASLAEKGARRPEIAVWLAMMIDAERERGATAREQQLRELVEKWRERVKSVPAEGDDAIMRRWTNECADELSTLLTGEQK